MCVKSMRGYERSLDYMKAAPGYSWQSTVTVYTVTLVDKTWGSCPLHLEYSAAAAYVCGGCKVTRPRLRKRQGQRNQDGNTKGK